MKISGLGQITHSGTAKKTGSTRAAGSFADILAAAETADAAPAAATGDVAAADLSNLLALQEISEEDVRRRKLVQQGKSLLDVLEGLRRQLLMGTLPPSLLRDLARQIELKKQTVEDPQLTAIIEDIELRAAVELAKLEAAMRGDNPLMD